MRSSSPAELVATQVYLPTSEVTVPLMWRVLPSGLTLEEQNHNTFIHHNSKFICSKVHNMKCFAWLCPTSPVITAVETTLAVVYTTSLVSCLTHGRRLREY